MLIVINPFVMATMRSRNLVKRHRMGHFYSARSGHYHLAFPYMTATIMLMST